MTRILVGGDGRKPAELHRTRERLDFLEEARGKIQYKS